MEGNERDEHQSLRRIEQRENREKEGNQKITVSRTRVKRIEGKKGRIEERKQRKNKRKEGDGGMNVTWRN